MGKLLYVLLFCTLLPVATYSQVLNYCTEAPKISYSGKAPWVIDGKITDWMTILGPYTGNNERPFSPPATSAFNSAFDRPRFADMPMPDNDISFLAFTHDDYNVYFYLRRMLNGSSPNTFYYFFDMNADAVMNAGEPVIHATFTNQSISSLTMGLYIPDKDSAYSQQKKGNYMQSGSTGVHRYPMPGYVFDLFTSEFAFFPVTLRKNEVFRAKLTEDGYGMELAIPWRYLRNWLTLKDPLSPGDIFLYKVSMQEGSGAYKPPKVVDNAGSCLCGLGISGNNLKLDKNLTTTVVTPGSRYRFKLEYTNLTNVATNFELKLIELNYTPNPELPVTPNDVDLTVYLDNNCNGTVDAGETAQKYEDLLLPCCTLEFSGGGSMRLPSLQKGCFIVDLTLPANGVFTKFKISFSTAVIYAEWIDPCGPSGGGGTRPINTVGFMETEIGSNQLITEAQKSSMLHEERTNSGVILYPNPSSGITNLSLSQSADVSVVDNLGRSIQTIKNAKAGIIQLKNLKAGFYIVKVRIVETGEVITRKLIIQP